MIELPGFTWGDDGVVPPVDTFEQSHQQLRLRRAARVVIPAIVAEGLRRFILAAFTLLVVAVLFADGQTAPEAKAMLKEGVRRAEAEKIRKEATQPKRIRDRRKGR